MNIETDYTNCPCTGCKNYRSEKHIPEADPNAVYNAKVREIAEELASKTKPGYYAIVKAKELEPLERLIKEYMPAARAMVAKMAEEFDAGFNSIYDFTNDPEFGPIIKQQLTERGMIPAKHEE